MPKVKIEMQDPDEVELVHTLPTLDELPDVGKPVHPPAEVAAANAVAGAGDKKKKLKDVVPASETFPVTGPQTPMSAFMNQPLGVKKAMAHASEALRARGHHVLAGRVDLASQALPDSPYDLVNAGVMGYGASEALRAGGGAPEGTEPPTEPTGSGVAEAPVPPAAPKLPMPDPLPDIGEQYQAAQGDPRTPGGPGIATSHGPIVPPNPPPPDSAVTFENKTPNRTKIDAFKKGAMVGGGVGAAAVGTSGSASASTPDFDTKEQGLMQSMAALGHPIVKVSGDRSAEEQAKLYGQTPKVTDKSGAPGDESTHQLGLAGDYAFVGPDGKPDFSQDQPWDTLGRMAKIHGFQWGGDFKDLKDFGHVQLSPGQTGGQAGTPTPQTGPTPGIKVEPMAPAETKKASSLPVWQQYGNMAAESLPFVAGATGGMLGGVAGAPTAAVSGPIGPALTAAGGAYAGGLVGETLKKLWYGATGQELNKPLNQKMDEVSAGARSQMYQEMVGQGFQAYMAARAATSRAMGSLQNLATSEAHDLRLSAADLSNSSIARGASRVMNYISQTARTVTDSARELGDTNAVKAVKDALDKLTPFHSNVETGTDIQAGVKAGIKGMKEGPVGQMYEAAKTTGPNVDLRPMLQDLVQTFQREGTTPAARAALLKQFPDSVSPSTANKFVDLTTGTDPYTVTFEQAAKLRTRLGLAGRKALEPVGTDATSLATKLYGDLSDELTRVSPAFGRASAEYATARAAIANRVIKAVLKNSPDKIVSALGPTPGRQTVDALRDTMLKYAQSSGVNTPEAVTGMQGFQALRRSWFDTHILKNSAGNFDPAGMVERMTKANGALQGFFGFNKYDTEGMAAVQTAKDIATALKARVGIPTGSAINWARAGELSGLVTTALRLGFGAGAVQVGAEEVLPGFITWAMHRPSVARMFIAGLQNPKTVQGAALMGRALGAYVASGGPNADPEPDPDDPNDPNNPNNLPVYQPPAPGQPGAKGTSGQSDSSPGPGPGPGPQAKAGPQSTDPMTGAAINVHTWDPDAVAAPQPEQTVAGVGASVGVPHPPAPPELQPTPRPSAFAKATGISATPTDELVSRQRLAEEANDEPYPLVTAVADKIRHWGQTVGSWTAGTDDWLLASLGGAFMGGTAGGASELERQTTPSAIASGMLPIHELEPLAQLSRSLGASAEGFPGLYSRLTRAVEALPANKLGMVQGKKVLDVLKTVNPDEVAWKEVVPWLRDRMGSNPQTPVSKTDLLAHLNKNRINLQVKSTGEPSHIQLTLGEKSAYGQSETEGQGYSAKIMSADGEGNHNKYIGDAQVYPVYYEGDGEQWQANLPRSYLNQGLPAAYRLPEDAKLVGTYGDTATFSSFKDADNWIEARLSMGARDPNEHTPQFEKLYALPGEPPPEGKNYRETRVTMPGGEAEGQNPKLIRNTFTASAHYPESNIVGTTRGQDYQLPRWKVEGAPDPNAGMLEGETPEQWEARRVEMNQPVRGTVADEFQADVHEEAGRAYDKIVEDARESEINRRVIRSQRAHNDAGGNPMVTPLTAAQAAEQVPKRAFEKPHIEVRDNDDNGKVIGRFLKPEDAARFREVEADNFPNTEAVNVKGVDKLAGYQQAAPNHPEVKALVEESKQHAIASDKADEEVANIREEYSTAKQLAQDRYAQDLGYKNFDDMDAHRFYNPYNGVHGGPEEVMAIRDKAREAKAKLADYLDKDPDLMEVNSRLIAKRLEVQNANRARQEAEHKLLTLQGKTGNWELYTNEPVPNFPFKEEKDWAGLGIKHEILKHAATTPEETTFFGHAGGKENADRYNLMNHFDEVRYDPKEEELQIYQNGRQVQAYPMKNPTKADLTPYVGGELADRLAEKIRNYEPSMRDDDGLPGTQSERERADEEDYQNQWDREYEYQRRQHTVEEYEEPILDDNDEPKLDEHGDPETETRWRVYEDDNFDESDPDTYDTFDTEREANRFLDRRLESVMDGFDYQPSDDVYDHLDRNSEVDEDAYPSLSGLDLSTGGEGMLSFYDHKVKRWVEQLLGQFGGEAEMRKVAVPGKKGPSYMWITKLTPEMKAKILKSGFSLMALSLAVRETNAPQEVKDTLAKAARKETLAARKQSSSVPPVRQGARP